ncbi:hypothetical protein CANTEDRAFT_124613 [Yamadazyma tenuis ATCC 10573]|nr:uncharacterized protein CANTEDRAFT_124613 [Yamadazyma tenuis ATCC 10573]EGV61651.1 hypothetical protein CANTEDRAFT_124613 [Yamadazyma tenuis ATCC 10573]
MARGDWRIQNITEFRAEAAKHNNTVQEEIFRQIHHQLYWSSIYVTKDATADYLKFIEGSNPSFNISTAIQSIYETGRDFVNMQSYVTPQIEYVEKQWLSRQNRLAGLFNSSESFTMEQVSRLSTPFRFEYLDHIPFTNPTLVAPSQVGLIYLIILTFFQVNMFSGIHQEMATIGMKNHHYLFYRLLSSSVSYFILSLGYSLVSLAFQVDFTVAFGKAGFLVYWMFSFITMMAVGFMNEVAFMILLMVFPPVAGFWLLFWVLINISSTFSPIALCPEFYRFGYAMPIHNSYELTKVVFFNTYKGQMGRNVGIIFAWIVIGMGSFSVVIPIFGKTMKKRAIAAKQKEAAAAAAKANENTKQEV